MTRFGLIWPTKDEAHAAALRPAQGQLRPEVASVEDDLLVVGDNLDALKLLEPALRGQVRLLLTDPPYNTRASLVYHDDWRAAPSDTIGPQSGAERDHAGWVDQMYPRLMACLPLLAPDAVVAIHIDEHEEHVLGVLLGEVFGHQNRLGTCIWDKRNPKGDAAGLAYQHEAIVLWARDRAHLLRHATFRRPKANAARMLASARRIVAASASIDEARAAYRAWVRAERSTLSGGEAMYERLDANGRVYRLVSMAWPNRRAAPDVCFEPLVHPTTGEPCPVPARGWRNRPETMQRLWAEGRIEFGPDHTTQPQRRYYLDEHPTESVPSIVRWAGSDDALFAAWDLPFDHPKPVRFTADLIQWFGGTSGVVLDPFAGSGTVGHATWMANAADGGTRRFVLVQNEEPARVGRFRTVAEIAEARLHRAAQETGTTFRRIDICAAMRGAGDTAQEEGRGGPARSATAPPKNIR